jgi:hypothetical protein
LGYSSAYCSPVKAGGGISERRKGETKEEKTKIYKML